MPLIKAMLNIRPVKNMNYVGRGALLSVFWKLCAHEREREVSGKKQKQKAMQTLAA